MSLFRRKYTGPKTKKCKHFEDVVVVCDRVLDGDIPQSEVGTKTLAEEYLLLHLEFEALRTHLAGGR